MAQGKLKVKSKVPPNATKKKTKIQQNKPVKNRGKVVKKSKNPQIQLTSKFNKEVQKKINASIEAELASRAQRVEEGKTFLAIGKDLNGKKNGR